MTDDAIRAVLAEALPDSLGNVVGLRRPALPTLGVESSITGFGELLLDRLLPTVRRLMRQQAAEELRAAADSSGLMSSQHGKTIPVACLRARAAALAPEPS